MKIVEVRENLSKRKTGKKGVVKSYFRILLPTCSTFKLLN